MDVPFFRFAYPVLILWIFWKMFVVNPWVELTEEEAKKYLSVETIQELIHEARVHTEKGRLKEALVPLRRLHLANPDNAIYLRQIAKLEEDTGNPAEAVRMWKLFMQHSPTPIEACPQVGMLQEKLGDRKGAFESYEQCWTIEPDNSDSILFYAHAMELTGQTQKALELYEKGVKRVPDYTDLQVGLARMQAKTGQTRAAQVRIEEVLQKRPQNVDALLVAGMVYKDLGDFPTARRHLQYAHERSPEYGDVTRLLASVGGGGAK